MRTLALSFVSTLTFFTAVSAQNSITCVPSATLLCQGSTFVVDYTATGTFDGANTFIALLSDENGTFASPTMIGQTASSVSGTIACTIPASAVPAASYRILVQATMPLMTGDVNPTDIIILGSADAGTDGSVALCSNGTSIVLTTGGDTGGTWFDPDLVPVAGVFVPGVSEPGCYRYILPGNGPCPSDTATLCLTVPLAPNAGSDNTMVICSTDEPFPMLPYLGGSPEPGGTWTAPTGAVHSGIFNPQLDVPGCHVYVVAGMPPCADEAATLCIFVSQAADAGISTTDTICPDAPALGMFEQLGGEPQVSGTWSYMGQPHSPVFVPDVDPEGCYHYTVQGMPPCVNDSSVWCVILDSCITMALPHPVASAGRLRQIAGWGTDRPVFAFHGDMSAGPQVLDPLGRLVTCPIAFSRRGDDVVFTLDVSGLARGGYWVVTADAMHRDAVRITTW